MEIQINNPCSSLIIAERQDLQTSLPVHFSLIFSSETDQLDLGDVTMLMSEEKFSLGLINCCLVCTV